MQFVKRMASYNDTTSEISSSSASESETEIGLFDENGKKISVRGKKITKCKLILRSGVSLIQWVNVACTSKDQLLLKKDTSTSSKDKSFCEESSLAREQVKMFEIPSKRQRQTYLKKAIEKKVSKPNQLCQVCNQSTNIPWIGCDYEWANGKICEYWVHALCLGFPDAEGETFENMSFHCPPHNRANIVSASSKKKKSSSFWKS